VSGFDILNMDHPMTIRLQASVQSLAFIILLAVTLFGTVGRFDIIEFWVYIAIVAAVSALSLTILDTDLMQERMRPGGRRVGWHFLPLTLLIFVRWAVAGLDRGHLHISDVLPAGFEVVALALFALAWIVLVWAMYVNRFFSSIPRIQSERGHTVISTGPYRFVRHPDGRPARGSHQRHCARLMDFDLHRPNCARLAGVAHRS
jgi:uncharacterized membrane protein YhdT